MNLLFSDAAPYLVYEFIDQTLQPGPPVCLKCSCRGSPTPQISWTKNGFPLPKSERYYILMKIQTKKNRASQLLNK